MLIPYCMVVLCSGQIALHHLVPSSNVNLRVVVAVTDTDLCERCDIFSKVASDSRRSSTSLFKVPINGDFFQHQVGARRLHLLYYIVDSLAKGKPGEAMSLISLC